LAFSAIFLGTYIDYKSFDMIVCPLVVLWRTWTYLHPCKLNALWSKCL